MLLGVFILLVTLISFSGRTKKSELRRKGGSGGRGGGRGEEERVGALMQISPQSSTVFP